MRQADRSWLQRAEGGLLWHTATVAADAGGDLWLEFPDPSRCERCANGQGCGAAALTRLFVRSGSRLPLEGRTEFEVGERVRVGVGQRWLLKAAAFSYIAPLVAFIAGALASQAVAPDRDAVALVAGLTLALISLSALRAPRIRLSRPTIVLQRLSIESGDRLETGGRGAHLDAVGGAHCRDVDNIG